MLFPDSYEGALEDAPPWVREAWSAYQQLPEDEQLAVPFLYFVLGRKGTPPFKVSKDNALYFDPSPVKGAQCSGCPFAYEKVTKRGRFICSQIRGTIEPDGWCVIPHLRGVWKSLKASTINKLIDRVEDRRSA